MPIVTARFHRAKTATPLTGYPCQASDGPTNCTSVCMALAQVEIHDTKVNVWLCLDHADKLETQLQTAGLSA